MNLITTDSFGGDEVRNDHAIFVSGPLGLGEQAPMGDERFTLVETEDDIAIADIDREKHLIAT